MKVRHPPFSSPERRIKEESVVLMGEQLDRNKKNSFIIAPPWQWFVWLMSVLKIQLHHCIFTGTKGCAWTNACGSRRPFSI